MVEARDEDGEKKQAAKNISRAFLAQFGKNTYLCALLIK